MGDEIPADTAAEAPGASVLVAFRGPGGCHLLSLQTPDTHQLAAILLLSLSLQELQLLSAPGRRVPTSSVEGRGGGGQVAVWSRCLRSAGCGTNLGSVLVACNPVCLLARGQKRKLGSPEADEHVLY